MGHVITNPLRFITSVTTILSETSGNKAALERWARKTQEVEKLAAARGTKVTSLNGNYLLGVDKDPQIEDPEIHIIWKVYRDNLGKLENVIWVRIQLILMIMLGVVDQMVYQEFGIQDFMKEKNFGWAGAPDIVAEYKGKIVLGDLKQVITLLLSMA